MFYKVYLSVIAFLFGLVVGSFDNVAIYRVPEGESLVSPRSFCPKCKNPIAWYDNIPLISYIILRGRCRHCGLSISPRYPLVEMTSGLLFLAVFAKSGFTWNDEFPFHLFMVTVLLIVSVMDLQKQVIPNKIILPSAAVALVAVCVIALSRGDAGYLYDKLLGLAVGGVPLGLLALAVPKGMGMGDAKLAAFTGVMLGWRSQLVAFFFAFLLGSIYGIATMAAGKKGRKSRLPFGPFLSLGALIALFSGIPIWDFYRNLFPSSPAK